jgi:hypothetical protein
MKTVKRQKLCYNCDGDIDLDVIVCPFCAADLREEKPELKEASPKSYMMRQMSHSLYPPPYPIREEEPSKPLQELPTERPAPIIRASVEEGLEDDLEPSERVATVVGPVLLFTLGVMLSLLGLLLVLCSQNGQVVLKWDASLWFLYLFASVPFLIFGYRAISKL